MSSTQFMDKQITELSTSQTHDFLGLSGSMYEEESEDEDRSFRFSRPRPLHTREKSPDGAHLMGWGPMDGINSTTENVGSSYDMELISAIDRNMKGHVDTLLHIVEGISARVSQLESRTRKMENGIDELTDSVEYYHGKTHGKLRELESILTEVQGCIQDMRDKQEIAEAQLHLAKLHVSKNDLKLGNQNRTSQTDPAPKTSTYSSQESQLVLVPVASPQQLSGLPSSIPQSLPQNLPALSPSQTPLAMAPQLPIQTTVPSIQLPECSPATAVVAPENMQHYYTPFSQQSQPPPSSLYHSGQLTPELLALHQSYQPRPQHPSPQPPQLPQMHPPLRSINPQAHHPLNRHPDEVTFMASQGGLKSAQLAARSLPLQQSFMGATKEIHDQPSTRLFSELPPGYSQPTGLYGPGYRYHDNASPASYGASTVKTLQFSPSSTPGSGSGYSQLPTAKILPSALPTASVLDSESVARESRNSVPVDNVVDKVVAMGFRRDVVRATVRQLTANRQSVDLNMVLDRLMNDGKM